MPQTGQSSVSFSGSRTASARLSSAATLVARVASVFAASSCLRWATRRARRPRGSARRPAARGRRAGAGSRCRRCSRERPRAAARSRPGPASSRRRRRRRARRARRRGPAGRPALARRLTSLRWLSRLSRVAVSWPHQLVDVGEAEHRRQRLVERGERVEHRRQLGVGEERPERGQRAVPAVRGEHRGGGRAAAHVVVGRALGPLLRERAVSLEPSIASSAESRVGPSWCRHCQVSVHAFGRFSQRFSSAGHQQLEAFGERRLAAAVAADDDGQARAGLERQRRGRADPAEALDGDRAQPHRRRGARRRARARVARELDHVLGLGVELARFRRSSSRVRRTGSIGGRDRRTRSSRRGRAARGARSAASAAAGTPAGRRPQPHARRERAVERARAPSASRSAVSSRGHPRATEAGHRQRLGGRDPDAADTAARQRDRKLCTIGSPSNRAAKSVSGISRVNAISKATVPISPPRGRGQPRLDGKPPRRTNARYPSCLSR